MRCAHLGCTTFFHPLCVERGGKGYLRTRLGEREAFCHQHIPEGVDRCEGYLVDGPEIHRFRISLDRSRVILDTLLRREKLKLRLCRLEGDHFASDFYRTLDRAKGRKHDTTHDTLDMGNSESESEYGDEDDEEEGGSGDDENQLKSILPTIEIEKIEVVEVELKKDKSKSKAKEKIAAAAAAAAAALELIHCPMNFNTNKSNPITVISKGRELIISSAWSNNKEACLPRRLGVLIVGLHIQKKDIAIEGGRKTFLRILKEKIDGNLINSRLLNSIFGSQREANDFAKKLVPSLLAHMAMSEADFCEAMGRMHIIAYPEFDRLHQRQQTKTLKSMQKKAKNEENISTLPRSIALFDVDPNNPEGLHLEKRKSVPVSSQYSQDIDEESPDLEAEVEVDEEEEVDLKNRVEQDIDEVDDLGDVDFTTSDFFMTDYEAEREVEIKASSALQTAFSRSLHTASTSPPPVKPLSIDSNLIPKPKKPSRERDRKKEKNGKEKEKVKEKEKEKKMDKNIQPLSDASKMLLSANPSRATMNIVSQSSMIVKASVAPCPIDLSMVSIPVRGRKRDRERDAKRVKAAAVAIAAAAAPALEGA